MTIGSLTDYRLIDPLTKREIISFQRNIELKNKIQGFHVDFKKKNNIKREFSCARKMVQRYDL
jgi:hypothetical protein